MDDEKKSKEQEFEEKSWAPGEKLCDGFGGENWRGVTIGDAVNVRLDILVGNDREKLLEGVTVGLAIQTMSSQVLNVCIARQNFRKNPLLNFICVSSHILYEVQNLPVFLCKVMLLYVGVSGSLRHGDHRRKNKSML